MSENKITIEEAIKQISEGFSSIYSKDDVLHLLSVLETNDIELDESAISDICSDIAEELSLAGADIVDDYTLTMDYREVELDSIDLNKSKIQAAVETALENHINR